MAAERALARNTGVGSQTQSLGHWRTRVILIILVLLTFGLYLYRIEYKGLWWDESLSLYRAQLSTMEVLSGRIAFDELVTQDQHPPLYFILLHFLIRISGESDLVLRFLSVAFGILILPLLYAMGVRLRGERAGLFAAAMGALSPFYLWYAQEARMYTMVTALGLGSTYALWRAITGRQRAWAPIFGLLVVAAALTQYLYLLLVGIQALLGLLLWRQQRLTRPDTAGGHGIAGGYWAWVWKLLPALGVLLAMALAAMRVMPSLSSNRSYVPLDVMFRDAFNSLSLGLSVHLNQIWWLDIIFAAVYALGIMSLWHVPPLRPSVAAKAAMLNARFVGLVYLLGSICVPIVVLWIASLFIPVYMGSRYILVYSPAFYLGLGVALDALWQWKRPAAWVVAMVLLAGMGYSAYRYFEHPHYRAKEDYRAAARAIEAHERLGDAIVVTGAESLPAFKHYYRGQAPVIALPKGGATAEQWERDLQEVLDSCERLFVVRGNSQITDPRGRLWKWLAENRLLLWRKSLPGYVYAVYINAYLPRSPVLAAVPSGPGVGVFQEQLALDDVRLRFVDESGQPQTIGWSDALRTQAPESGVPVLAYVIPAGQQITSVLTWRPVALLTDYKTSLRLVDARGTLWQQSDEQPYEFYATSKWPLGAAVRQETSVRIPVGTPPGQYYLQLVLYHASDGSPLPFRHTAGGEEAPFLALGRATVGSPLPGRAIADSPPGDLLGQGRRASFGGGMGLIGYRLGSAAVSPGQGLRVEVYWRGLRTMSKDYELVMRWRDASGQILGSSRHSPTGTDYVTSRWHVGEMLRGLLLVPVPVGAPLGEQELLLSVEPAGESATLPLHLGLWPWAGHALPLGKITFEAPRD